MAYKRTGDLMPVMTRFARVAPAGLAYYRGTALGPEYRGNLFSAHFNPHRILRHVLHRDGATFRTDDEDFLTSVDIDFHPTDVGRLDDARAVPALLAASASPDDRFVEHAVIHALILLRRPEPLIQALKDSRPPVQKAALIALDQMDGKPLQREHLMPLLRAGDEKLAEAVLWVAGHHKDWSADVLEFVRARFRKGTETDVLLEAYRHARGEEVGRALVAALFRSRHPGKRLPASAASGAGTAADLRR